MVFFPLIKVLLGLSPIHTLFHSRKYQQIKLDHQPEGQDIVPGIQVRHLYKVPCGGLLGLFWVQSSHRPLGSLRVGAHICPHCPAFLLIIAPLHTPHKVKRCLLEAVLCKTRNAISRPPGTEISNITPWSILLMS